MYDSAPDTRAHIKRVRDLLARAEINLYNRGANHDKTKLIPPEKPAYDRLTDAIRSIEYGTPEYFAQFEQIRPELNHHFAHNKHHPEYWVSTSSGEGHTYDKAKVQDGTAISRMSLLDILEMLCDWKAASERHPSRDFRESFTINQHRFGISDQLMSILMNTARELGYFEETDDE